MQDLRERVRQKVIQFREIECDRNTILTESLLNDYSYWKERKEETENLVRILGRC